MAENSAFSREKNNNQAYELNYVTANRFYIEMEQTITASFSECSGLGMEIQKETISEGGVNDQQRILLGQPKFTDVTLKRGITDDLVFWNWVMSTFNNAAPRRHINILLFNQAGETMQCWTLIGAVPVGWKAPALQADANTVAIEELTLAYEGLNIEKRTPGGGATELISGRDPSGYFIFTKDHK